MEHTPLADEHPEMSLRWLEEVGWVTPSTWFRPGGVTRSSVFSI